MMKVLEEYATARNPKIRGMVNIAGRFVKKKDGLECTDIRQPAGCHPPKCVFHHYDGMKRTSSCSYVVKGEEITSMIDILR